MRGKKGAEVRLTGSITTSQHQHQHQHSQAGLIPSSLGTLMKGADKILKLRLVQLPYFNMLIVKAKDVKMPQLIKAPRLKLVLFC